MYPLHPVFKTKPIFISALKDYSCDPNTGVVNALSSAPQAVTWKTFSSLFRSQCCPTDINVFTIQSMTDQACPCFVSRTIPVIQIPTVHNIKFNLDCRINRCFSVFTGKAGRKEKERRCTSRRGQGREGHSRVLVDHLQERWDGSRDDLGTRRTNSWKAHRRYSFLQWKANGNSTCHRAITHNACFRVFF